MNGKKNIKLILITLLVCILSSCVKNEDKIRFDSSDNQLCVTSTAVLNDTIKTDNIIQECIDDYNLMNNNSIVDTLVYDIDDDNIDELMIMSEGTLLYNSRELYVYKIWDDEFKYCGLIPVTLQSEFNEDITNELASFNPYETLSVSRLSYDGTSFNVLMYSVYTFSSHYNYINTLTFDTSGMVNELPILYYGIDVNHTASGDQWICHYYKRDIAGNREIEIAKDEFNSYLLQIESE